MSSADLALQAIVALAAAMQAITGLGFAMIAGPFIILAMSGTAPIQVTSMLSLLISLTMIPWIWRSVDGPTFKTLCLGGLFGLPPGLLLFAAVSGDVLKLIAGVTVGGLTWLSFRSRVDPAAVPTAPGRSDWTIAGVSGLFGGCLAMPGPTAAARMNARGIPKEVTRATIPAFFLFIYPIIILAHSSTLGGFDEAVGMAAWLAPGALIGTAIGAVAAPRVSQRFFRNMVLLLLAATALTLLIAAARGFLGGV